MLIHPEVVAGLALLGLTTGFLAGLLGVGGGMMMVPVITLLMSSRGVDANLSVKMAIATSMATILFTSLSSVRAHHAHGAVRWDLVRGLAPGIALGAALASLGVFSMLKGSWLAVFFGLFVGFSATRMMLNPKPVLSHQVPGTAGQVAAGGMIGFLSGLVGAGGAFVSVPFMTWCNVPMHNAIATSAAIGFPVALVNVAGYILAGQSVPNLPAGSLGYIWLPALAIIAACSVLTAPLGAKAAHALPVQKLKRVFASILYALAGYMLYKGLGT